MKTEDPEYDTSDMILRNEEEYKLSRPKEIEDNPPLIIEPQALQRRKRFVRGTAVLLFINIILRDLFCLDLTDSINPGRSKSFYVLTVST